MPHVAAHLFAEGLPAGGAVFHRDVVAVEHVEHFEDRIAVAGHRQDAQQLRHRPGRAGDLPSADGVGAIGSRQPAQLGHVGHRQRLADGLTKVLAQNHQYLGVNNAIAATLAAREAGHGRAGVFWQTQGSGKSFAMVFFAQKILRKLPGNWTFVIVTDRVELDGQIAKTFKATGAVSETEGDQCLAGDWSCVQTTAPDQEAVP